MGEYIIPCFRNLVDSFGLLPGVGERTAQKFAYFLVSMSENDVAAFARALLEAKTSLRLCSVCKNFTESTVCSICTDEKRDNRRICVVEYPEDVVTIEKHTNSNFLYHVLHGAISPLDGKYPNNIYVNDLLLRLNKNKKITEVILATSSTVAGETTAIYMKNLITSPGIKVTRLACGIPTGTSLGYVDEVTLKSAIINRIEI